MGDSAARHCSTLRGTEGTELCRVMTLCNKRRKFQGKQFFFLNQNTKKS